MYLQIEITDSHTIKGKCSLKNTIQSSPTNTPKTALCPNEGGMLSTEVTQNRGPLFSLPSQGWEAAADPMAWTTSGPACTLSTAIT